MTTEEKSAVSEQFNDMRTATIRVFDSGATRSAQADKPEYAGYLSPQVIQAFGRYMFKHQLQADGTLRESRNWQKGIPLESYMQSMFRHFVEVWTLHEQRTEADNHDAMMEALMALMFNVQGYAHEYMKGGE